MRIFMIQGTIIGVVGVAFGIVFGILGALNVDVIVGFVERVFGFKFLPSDVYLISDLPSELRYSDVDRDGRHLAHAVVARDDLSELARIESESGGGAAL